MKMYIEGNIENIKGDENKSPNVCQRALHIQFVCKINARSSKHPVFYRILGVTLWSF